MYQALYRKWRPRTFDEVIGQPQVTDILSTQVKNGKLSHAYLFVGSRGTGKTTCARILARAVNCDNPQNGNPCCKCTSCLSIIEGSAPEIVEIDAASNNGVDDVRALRDEAIYSPATLKKRVYIIDEVHMLSKPAFNALLKILEEPPAHLLFILATTELNKVPATILSRCQRFNFKRISNGDIADYLKYVANNEQLQLADDAADLLARMAEGGMRDALSLLDQCASYQKIDVDCVNSALGIASNAIIQNMLSSILNYDTESVVKSFETLWDEGKSPVSVLKDLSALVRDSLMAKVLKSGADNLISGNFDITTVKHFADACSSGKLISLQSSIIGGLNTISSATNPRIAAELCLISLCCDSSDVSLADRVKKLEIIVASGVCSKENRDKSDREEECRSEHKSSTTLPLRPLVQEYEDAPDQTAEIGSKDEKEHDGTDSIPEVKADAGLSSEDDEIPWDTIVKALKPGLPMDMQVTLENPAIVTGRLSEGKLTLLFEPGYAYGRFNSGENAETFSRNLKSKLNLDVRVIFEEHKSASSGPSKSLDDLRSFGVVNFV